MIIMLNIFYLWNIYNFLQEIDGNWSFNLYKVNKKQLTLGFAWKKIPRHFEIWRNFEGKKWDFFPSNFLKLLTLSMCVSYMCVFWFSVINSTCFIIRESWNVSYIINYLFSVNSGWFPVNCLYLMYIFKLIYLNKINILCELVLHLFI